MSAIQFACRLFHTHLRYSTIYAYFQLNLPLLNVDPSALKKRLFRGTMKVPALDADLKALPRLMALDAPDRISNEKGEVRV